MLIPRFGPKIKQARRGEEEFSKRINETREEENALLSWEKSSLICSTRRNLLRIIHIYICVLVTCPENISNDDQHTTLHFAKYIKIKYNSKDGTNI